MCLCGVVGGPGVVLLVVLGSCVLFAEPQAHNTHTHYISVAAWWVAQEARVPCGAQMHTCALCIRTAAKMYTFLKNKLAGPTSCCTLSCVRRVCVCGGGGLNQRCTCVLVVVACFVKQPASGGVSTCSCNNLVATSRVGCFYSLSHYLSIYSRNPHPYPCITTLLH